MGGQKNIEEYLSLFGVGNIIKQAGAELGQAHLQLELRFTLIKVCCILLMITNYHYISLSIKSVNLVTSTYLHTSLLNC